MPIDVSLLKNDSPHIPLIPKGERYRYDPIDYEEDEWVLTYQYTYEDEHHVRIVFKDAMGGSHVRMIFKDKAIKDF